MEQAAKLTSESACVETGALRKGAQMKANCLNVCVQAIMLDVYGTTQCCVSASPLHWSRSLCRAALKVLQLGTAVKDQASGCVGMCNAMYFVDLNGSCSLEYFRGDKRC